MRTLVPTGKALVFPQHQRLYAVRCELCSPRAPCTRASPLPATPDYVARLRNPPAESSLSGRAVCDYPNSPLALFFDHFMKMSGKQKK